LSTFALSGKMSHAAGRREARRNHHARAPRCARLLNKPDATAAAIDAEVWFRAGDIGYLDGLLYICDRLKDVIVMVVRTSARPKSKPCSMRTLPLPKWR